MNYFKFVPGRGIVRIEKFKKNKNDKLDFLDEEQSKRLFPYFNKVIICTREQNGHKTTFYLCS